MESPNTVSGDVPSSEISGRLTFDRLITKINALADDLTEQYPGKEDVQRVRAIRKVVARVILKARAASNNTNTNVSPRALKHEVTEKVEGVNKRFDAAAKIVGYVEEARQYEEDRLFGTGDRCKRGEDEEETVEHSKLDLSAEALLHSTMRGAAAALQSMTVLDRPSKKPAKARRSKKSAAAKSSAMKSAITVRLITGKPAERKPAVAKTAKKIPITDRKTRSSSSIILQPAPAPQLLSSKRKRSSEDEVAISSSSPLPSTTSSSSSYANGFSGESTPSKRARVSSFNSIPELDPSSTPQELFLQGVEYGLHWFRDSQEAVFGVVMERFGAYGVFRNRVVNDLGLVGTVSLSEEEAVPDRSEGIAAEGTATE